MDIARLLFRHIIVFTWLVTSTVSLNISCTVSENCPVTYYCVNSKCDGMCLLLCIHAYQSEEYYDGRKCEKECPKFKDFYYEETNEDQNKIIKPIAEHTTTLPKQELPKQENPIEDGQPSIEMPKDKAMIASSHWTLIVIVIVVILVFCAAVALFLMWRKYTKQPNDYIEGNRKDDDIEKYSKGPCDSPDKGPSTSCSVIEVPRADTEQTQHLLSRSFDDVSRQQFVNPCGVRRESGPSEKTVNIYSTTYNMPSTMPADPARINDQCQRANATYDSMSQSSQELKNYGNASIGSKNLNLTLNDHEIKKTAHNNGRCPQEHPQNDTNQRRGKPGAPYNQHTQQSQSGADNNETREYCVTHGKDSSRSLNADPFNSDVPQPNFSGNYPCQRQARPGDRVKLATGSHEISIRSSARSQGMTSDFASDTSKYPYSDQRAPSSEYKPVI